MTTKIEMRETKEGFYHFAKRMSQKHYQYFTKLKLSNERQAFFDREAERSMQKQLQIESSDTQSLDEYLKAYFSQA